MEDYDDNELDSQDVSGTDMEDSQSDVDNEDLGDMPELPDETDGQFSDEIPDMSEDMSEPSIAELYEQSQRDALEQQQAAEDWADANGMTEWSDGSSRVDADEEMPELPDEMSDGIDEQVADGASDDMDGDMSEPSIAELYEQSQRDALEKQQAAEDWADAHDVNAWSDGSMRLGHENDDYVRTSLEADQLEQEGLREQAEYYENKME